MKLFLASALSETIDQLFGVVPTIKKVAFIANASDLMEGEKWWIDIDRNAFVKKGCEVVEVDLREMGVEKFENILKEVDAIHFCGGSVLYLNKLLKEKGLADILVRHIQKDGLVYTSSSAGSLIVSKDLNICKYDCDEPKEYMQEAHITGLGLVDFIIMPHANNDDFKEANLAVIEHLAEFNQPVFFLYDGQAVFVHDEEIKIVS